ncbi:extracellular solute-binding protein [Saccharibacillus sp. CPCC 101409]|uniref:extracellular solute-binding protein n=1 Tax=Saccharibacillus sp. CPCC 101409 TaxID=3058041 RepID=UPI0026736BAB|nr:extracellular solute-binding protein [Saccharibacillus sp. CPCC 101409]MDO3412487.1 extracellular solute-binding protein [Saccharibacillus sp. CPCC 101409]
MTKKRIGKRLAGLAAAGLLTGVLSACGGGDAGKEAEASDPSKPVELDWLGYNSYAQPDPNADIVKMVEEKFNAKFNIWYVDAQQWNDQVNVKFAAGEIPDVLQIREQIPKYVANGILAEISEDDIRKYAPTYAKVIDDYDASLWNTVKYEGKIYGLPSINLNGDYPQAMIWRKDWLDKVGIDKIPETLDEFETALKKFRNEDPDGNGKKDTYGMSDYALRYIMGAYGMPADQANYVLKDGKIEFAAVQPEMKEALALLNKWYKEELIDPEFITGENTGGYWADSQAFYNNRIGLTGNGMFYHWRNELFGDGDEGGGQYQNFKKAQPDGEIAFGVPPVGPDGQSGAPQWGVNSVPLGITPKAAEDPRKVQTILTMLETSFTDYDYYTTVLRGEEGVDWKEETDGSVIAIKDPNDANASFKRGAQVFNMMENPEFGKKASKQLYAFGDSVKTKGYPPVVVPAVDSLSQYSGNLGKLQQETYMKIIIGEQPVDSFDAFAKSFMDNGGSQVEKDVNEAYQEMLGK